MTEEQSPTAGPSLASEDIIALLDAQQVILDALGRIKPGSEFAHAFWTKLWEAQDALDYVTKVGTLQHKRVEG